MKMFSIGGRKTWDQIVKEDKLKLGLKMKNTKKNENSKQGLQKIPKICTNGDDNDNNSK